MKKYVVRLTKEEREQLTELTRKGKAAAYKIKHANILLKADVDGPAWRDAQIAEAFSVNTKTVGSIRQRFVEQGLEGALNRKRRDRGPRKRKLDGEAEARLIALSCSKPPEGRNRWTLRLLADKVVELGIVDTLSYETVRRTLKKGELKPHLRKSWVIPPEQNAEFVARMEDVLELYHLPYDPQIPLVCMDEQPVQLIKERRDPLPAEPGKPARVDYEYERNGTANVFMFTEPLNGRRGVSVREHKTGLDWAYAIKSLLEVNYPEAERVRLVCDNLNTHKLGSLYEVFPPEVARQLAKCLEIHYTPKHGSWLNIAEIELSALTTQCLDRRIPDIQTLGNETKAWEKRRNEQQKGVDWQFTTKDAHIKLKRLYPLIKE
ncbi:IS630 family transposase [Dehalococcoidia bacterium]|nr:IS630 family transposase [Dehalococcoidia bacterium]